MAAPIVRCVSCSFRRFIPSKPFISYSYRDSSKVLTAYSTAAKPKPKNAAEPKEWRLFSAVCVQRYPVTITETTVLEKRFSELMSTMEYESSVQSDHELRHNKDLERAERLKKGEDNEEDEENMVTALDLEDAWENELNQFQPAPREYDVDKSSCKRKLDEKLLLVVKQKVGGDEKWCLPQGERQEGETLRETAERVLKSICGDVPVTFNGNAPCGFYKYTFTENNVKLGAKIFFFRAQLASNPMQSITALDNSPYVWLSTQELKEFLKTREYRRAVKPFLLDL